MQTNCFDNAFCVLLEATHSIFDTTMRPAEAQVKECTRNEV